MVQYLIEVLINRLYTPNTNIYKDVKDVPSDFIGDKYLYDGSKWSANPTWVDPSKEDE